MNAAELRGEPAPAVERADVVEAAARRLVETVRARRAAGWHKAPMREVELLAFALGLDPTTLTTADPKGQGK